MGSRMSWPQIRQSDEYRGRWVALDNCRYDAKAAAQSYAMMRDWLTESFAAH